MAGQVFVNVPDRHGVEIAWDNSGFDPSTPVTITAVNAETGDTGVALDTNDGYHELSYPAGFAGVDTVTVTVTETGEVVAEGVIAVKVAQ